MTKNRPFYSSLLLAVIVLALGGATAAYAGWNAPVPATVDSTDDVGEYTSLAVVAGNPAISYYDWDNGDLKYVRATAADGSSWGSPLIVAGVGGADVGLYTSLAVVAGNPAISYYDNGSGDLKYVRADDSTGSSWTTSPVTIDSSGDVGLYTSLVVVDGYPAISYYDSSNSDLKYVRATDSTGSSWGTPVTVDSDDNVGECTSLAVVNGYPAISYFDNTNGNLEYVRATDAAGSSWDTSVTVTSDGYVGADTSLAVVNGNPAISYYDIGNGSLKYVRATDAAGSSWGSPLTLDSTGDVGEYTSLAVVNGNPAISYYDGANGDLKYVQATDAAGGSWGSPLTLDSAGNVGEYTSLEAVNGYPAISYYASTNGDLKYLYFVPAPEIAVLGHGALIATGDTSPSLADSTMFLTPGGTVTHTFTISNSGELALNLTGSPVISITGPAAGDFSVTTQPVAPVSADSSTTFQVSFAPSVAGTRAATVTIANDDPDEAPYEFALQGNICSNAITVQNNADSGAGSLRQALADICDGGAIDFAADTAITLTSPLAVNRSVTLTGQGHTVTISGNDSVRVFWVMDSAHVSFDHLTIAHGKVITPESGSRPTGGGVKIEAGAVVTLTNSAVLSNSAVYYNAGYDAYFGSGGGIYNLGTLTVLTSTLSGNTSGSNAGWGDGSGGAIYSSGALTVINSTLSGNSAYNGSGGGLENDTGTLTVQNSTISGNTANCGGVGISSSRGTAAISDSTVTDNEVIGNCEKGAAGISNRFGTMTVVRSTIFGNKQAYSSGGGLSSYGYNPDQARLTVTDSSIYSNTTGSSGGGIHNWWDSMMTVTNSSIYSNTATFYGGGILSGPHANAKLTLINSTLAHNTAEDGGGLYNGSPGYSAAVLNMINSTVVSNTATNLGGGIYNRDSANVTLDNIILWGNTPADPQIYNNSANRPTISVSDIQNSGGSGAGWDTNLGSDGGDNLDSDPKLGPLADNTLSGTGGSDTLTIAVLPGSPAIDAGGAALCPATDQRGVTRPQGTGCDIGAYEVEQPEMAVIGKSTVISDGAATPATTDDTDFGNITLGQALTHTFTISNSGGEILNLTGTPVVSVTGPAAGNFSVVAQPEGTVGPGGSTTFAVRFTPSVSGTRAATITIANDDSDENPYDFAVQGTGLCASAITVQNANDSGAGSLRQALLDVCTGGTVDFAAGLAGQTITLTSAELGIAKTVTITNPNASGLSVSGNNARHVFNIQNTGVATISHLSIVSGTSTSGGGIRNTGTLTLQDSTLAGNSAGDSGGGLYNSSSNATLTNVTFSGNLAKYGGGMYVPSSSPTLTNITFNNNSANSGGGMFNAYGSNPGLTNVTFSNNSAGIGGGMFNTIGSSPTLTNVTFSANTATSGGGMYNHSSSPILTNVTISGNSATSQGGAIFNATSSNPTLTNVTISGNSAAEGGGMSNYDCSPSIRNTIFWDNTAGTGAQIYNDADSTPSVSDSVVQGDYLTGTNIITADPLLGTLGNYGGSMQTVPLLPGSAAIDAGASCPATDQRGVTRPQGAGCDIGAFESRGFTLTRGGGSGQSALINTAFAQPLTVTVTSAYTEPVDGGRMIYTGPGSGAGVTPASYTVAISNSAVTQVVTANSTVGSYVVTATTRGSLGSAVSFTLTNGIPEMAVLGNGQVIANGDTSPSPADHTDFGSAAILGGVLTRTFTISNSGNLTLTLTGSPVVTITGPAAGDFSVTAQPVTPVGPGLTTTFTVRFDPTVLGTRVATVTIANDDGDENPYSFAVQGLGAAPEMAVLGNGLTITTGDATPATADHTDFGSAAVSGGQITRTFTISNSGAYSLTLTGSPLVTITGPAAGDFSVTAQPVAPVGPGESTAFTVRFDPTLTGTRAATVIIANDDSDENPYDFAVQGVGTIPVVQFSQAGYQVNENGTAVGPTISLIRTGQLDGASQVRVSFTDGTASGGGTDYTSTPLTVTFAAGSVASQTVTVPITQDFIDEATESLTMTVVSLSNAHIGSQGQATLQILDDDTPGVQVSPLSLTVAEPAGTAVFTVSLTTPPTAAVTFTLTSTDTGECSVPASASLAPANWQTGVTVTVTAVDDFIDDGSQPCGITTTAGSSDPNYDGLAGAAVAVTVADDSDTAGLVIAPDSGQTSEDGGVFTFTVRLGSQPTGPVIIGLSTGAAAGAVSTSAATGIISPTLLTFTTLTWSQPQTVTVTGQDDGDTPTGDTGYSISLAVTSSTDPLYAVLPTTAVTVTNRDNDTPPIYLPLILHNFVSAPDLVITSLSSDATGPRVVIRNAGNTAVTDAFWVEVYYNPDETPGLNKIWPLIASAGAVWGVSEDIAPGGILTLTVGSSYYFPQYSSGSFPAGVPVYGYADSVNYATDYGAVRESNEGNNLFGAVTSTAGGEATSVGSPKNNPVSATLPGR